MNDYNISRQVRDYAWERAVNLIIHRVHHEAYNQIHHSIFDINRKIAEVSVQYSVWDTINEGLVWNTSY